MRRPAPWWLSPAGMLCHWQVRTRGRTCAWPPCPTRLAACRRDGAGSNGGGRRQPGPHRRHQLATAAALLPAEELAAMRRDIGHAAVSTTYRRASQLWLFGGGVPDRVRVPDPHPPHATRSPAFCSSPTSPSCFVVASSRPCRCTSAGVARGCGGVCSSQPGQFNAFKCTCGELTRGDE